MFISFEGLDVSGKSTQAARLADRFRRAGREVRLLREPGGTPIGEKVRAILLDTAHTEMSPAAELFLFSASRNQLVEEVVRPALARGEVVIADRFHDSTTAYQGSGRMLDPADVARINAVATAGILPAVTLFIDVTLEEIARRLAAAGRSTDRLERAGREFFERVRAGYLDLTIREPARVIRIDGMAPADVVEARVRAAVDAVADAREQIHGQGTGRREA